MIGGEGSWWIHSKSDPRWSRNGRGFVSGLMGPTDVDIEKLIDEMTKLYGEKPADLKCGWMKD